MQEQVTMEVIKWYIALFFMMGMLVLFIFFYQMSETNTFHSYVDSQIEQHGGLTQQAVDNIKQTSETSYGGRYSVTSPDMGVKQEYGTTVNYEVEASYKLILDILSDNQSRIRSTQGQARVLVKGASGD